MRLVLRDDGSVEGRYPDERSEGEWYPDDTIIRTETPQGELRPHGAMRVAKVQAADWPDRAGRAWDGNAWIRTPAFPGREQQGRARAEKRRNARKRDDTDLDLYERVADLEARVKALEGASPTRGEGRNA